MKLTSEQRRKAKRDKKDIERDKIFNRSMEENYPVDYKLNKMGYKVEKK